jgi:hypothetical protein
VVITARDEVSAILAILSAMITPVVLISACASLVISTSNRLGRAIERARKLTDQFTSIMGTEGVIADERRALLYDQLHRISVRTMLLHRALTCLYLSLGAFVAASIAIGAVELIDRLYAWLPLLLGMFGAALLFLTCALLITETRVARRAIRDELIFGLQMGARCVPEDLVKRYNNRHLKLRQ